MDQVPEEGLGVDLVVVEVERGADEIYPKEQLRADVELVVFQIVCEDGSDALEVRVVESVLQQNAKVHREQAQIHGHEWELRQRGVE